MTGTSNTMNGAEALVETLIDCGVDTCFSNPGTSEMHFVAALDKIGGMRCVLGLFEGVVTGAADGYYRMSDKPAVTLLHLGPGLGNGLANLHNAKKAQAGLLISSVNMRRTTLNTTHHSPPISKALQNRYQTGYAPVILPLKLPHMVQTQSHRRPATPVASPV